MKNPLYANRGTAFEMFIGFANDQYAKDKVAIIQKIPTEFIPIRDRYGKVCTVKVEKKSTVDFMGRYKQYPIAIEAKETKSGSIRFDAVQQHQAAFLDAFTAQEGVIGIILIAFDLKRFYAVPWAFWSDAYRLRVMRNDKTTETTIKHHGQTWKIPKKYSLREDELLPEWRVPGNAVSVGLNYLKNVENYITKKENDI